MKTEYFCGDIHNLCNILFIYCCYWGALVITLHRHCCSIVNIFNHILCSKLSLSKPRSWSAAGRQVTRLYIWTRRYLTGYWQLKCVTYEKNICTKRTFYDLQHEFVKLTGDWPTTKGKLVANVVTITELLSPPSRWLSTTEATPPSRCFTVFSAVFLGAVSWKLPFTI